MAKLNIDRKKCLGCGYCSEINKKHFGLEGNKAVVKKTDVKMEEVKEAIISCPAGAIKCS